MWQLHLTLSAAHAELAIAFLWCPKQSLAVEALLVHWPQAVLPDIRQILTPCNPIQVVLRTMLWGCEGVVLALRGQLQLGMGVVMGVLGELLQEGIGVGRVVLAARGVHVPYALERVAVARAQEQSA